MRAKMPAAGPGRHEIAVGEHRQVVADGREVERLIAAGGLVDQEIGADRRSDGVVTPRMNVLAIDVIRAPGGVPAHHEAAIRQRHHRREREAGGNADCRDDEFGMRRTAACIEQARVDAAALRPGDDKSAVLERRDRGKLPTGRARIGIELELVTQRGAVRIEQPREDQEAIAMSGVVLKP